MYAIDAAELLSSDDRASSSAVEQNCAVPGTDGFFEACDNNRTGVGDYGTQQFLVDLVKHPTRDVSAVAIAKEADVDPRGFCAECGFIVKLRGHDQRCRPSSKLGDSVKELAWVGNAVWQLFVRAASVELRLDKSVAAYYTTNASLSTCLEDVVAMIDLGRKPRSDSSVHTRATYVEAAIAVSAVCRVLVATKFLALSPKVDSLWRVSGGVQLQSQIMLVPQPSFDGYCYLALFSSDQWIVIAQQLRAYPTWQQVSVLLSDDSRCRLWLRVSGGFCHVSVIGLPGMVQYIGRAQELPIGASVVMGGKGVIDLTRLLMAMVVHASWPAGVVQHVDQLRDGVAQFRARDKVVMTTQRNWEQLSGLTQPFDQGSSRAVVSGLVRALTAMNAALAMIHVDTGYIATSGVLSVMTRDEADRVSASGVLSE